MPLVIRIAMREDLPRLHPVIERAYRGESSRLGWTHEADLLDGQRTDIASLTAIVDDPEQRLLIAEEAGEAIGCVNIADKGEGLAYFGLLCVEPMLQAAGIGRQVLAAAESCARDAFGARRIEMSVIDVRHRLIAWYERRGYVQTGEQRDFILAVEPPLFMTVLAKTLG